jgi:hypothetical protein
MWQEGKEEPVCPDEPEKSLPDLGKSLKAPPLQIYPENPPKPREKGSPTNPRSCASILLTHNSLFCIFKPP